MTISNLVIFDAMQKKKRPVLMVENLVIKSRFLKRAVKLDCFLPATVKDPASCSLLLINDGQDMEALGLAQILENLFSHSEISPLMCVAIHAGDRKMEYGTAKKLDYKGRGSKAMLYTRFIMEELLPFLKTKYRIHSFIEKAIAGFSMGGLSALDIAWNHPGEFSKVGVFSGSLWWRSKGLEHGYNESTDRIMHLLIREGKHVPGVRFFFQAGAEDEKMDRNNNGIIDAIDDTIGLIDELEQIGYDREKDIRYLELHDGRHDIPTWARAMPEFLKWGWGDNQPTMHS